MGIEMDIFHLLSRLQHISSSANPLCTASEPNPSPAIVSKLNPDLTQPDTLIKDSLPEQWAKQMCSKLLLLKN